MKKLLSIVLAVAMLASFACVNVSAKNASNPATEATADKTLSLLAADASAYSTVDGGNGKVTVTVKDGVHTFTADQGWPAAYTTTEDNAKMISVDFSKDDLYLNWDFEVKSGKSKVVVYLCGQNPDGMAPIGNFITLNSVINPSWYDPMTGDADGTKDTDLPVGVYKGSLQLSTLYKDVDFKKDPYVNPEMLIDNGAGTKSETNFSGYKVFAVGGEVVVNDLSIGKNLNGDAQVDYATTNLLTNGSSNGANGESTVTYADGKYTAKVTTPWGGSSNDVAYGMQVSASVNNYDITKTPYLHVGVTSDVPFRVTTCDASVKDAPKWLGLANNFTNIGPVGGAEIGSVPEGGFLPAGTYEIAVDYGSIYTWNAGQGNAGWDATNMGLHGIYFEAKEAGTFTVDTLTLTANPVFTAVAGNDSGKVEDPGDNTTTTTAAGGDNNTTTTAAGGNNNTATTTAAGGNNTAATTTKAGAANVTTTTVAASDSDGKVGDDVQTGDASQAILFTVIALAAAAVVVLSASKAKAQ